MAVQRFLRNNKGRDYVVGDLHGCYNLLLDKLDCIQFDFSNDRLFCVGDLVDRGPNSSKVVYLLDQPWFFSVTGNHERLAVSYHNEIAPNKEITEQYLGNGSYWFLELLEAEKRSIISRLEQLPIAIEVETGSGIVGIVHADCPYNNWTEFVNHLTDQRIPRNYRMKLVDTATRNRVRLREKDNAFLSGVNKVYHGHTTVVEPVTLGNRLYIDTGAVFTGNLTVLQLDSIV